MNQVKIGSFIKEIRKEKELTQEQLAEQFGVSRRTVSRWETGSNLPDLVILVELAKYFDVDLGELLNGERADKRMNKELEETVLKVADYSNEELSKVMKRMHCLFLAGLVAGIIYMGLLLFENADNAVAGFCLGVMIGMILVGAIMTSKYFGKIRTYKMRILSRLKK